MLLHVYTLHSYVYTRMYICVYVNIHTCISKYAHKPLSLRREAVYKFIKHLCIYICIYIYIYIPLPDAIAGGHS